MIFQLLVDYRQLDTKDSDSFLFFNQNNYCQVKMPLSYSNGDVNSFIVKNGTNGVSNGTNEEHKSAESESSRSRTTSSSISDS